MGASRTCPGQNAQKYFWGLAWLKIGKIFGTEGRKVQQGILKAKGFELGSEKFDIPDP